MSLKTNEIDSREMELETWPAFVDILSSTVVVLAFAFFIMVIVLSVSKITSSNGQSKTEESGGGAQSSEQETNTMSEKKSQFEKLAIVSPLTMAKNQEPSKKSTTDTESKEFKYVPENAKITDKQIQVSEPGQSQNQVLGDIPKFTDSRVLEVLKELITVQQQVIAQQRKVIEQQDTQIRQASREYQSLLSLVTPENKVVEDLKQEITPRDQTARFIDVDSSGKRLSGASKDPNGLSTYVLSPPKSAVKSVSISGDQGVLLVKFNDNAQYFNDANSTKVREELQRNLSSYQASGVVLTAKSSDFVISASEGKRISVERLLLIRSMLIEMGLDKSLIKFKTLSNEDDNNNKEEDYGWVRISPVE